MAAFYMFLSEAFAGKSSTPSDKNIKATRKVWLLLFPAVRTGLEPATLGVTGRYSNQLNYRTNKSVAKIAYISFPPNFIQKYFYSFCKPLFLSSSGISGREKTEVNAAIISFLQ